MEQERECLAPNLPMAAICKTQINNSKRQKKNKDASSYASEITKGLWRR